MFGRVSLTTIKVASPLSALICSKISSVLLPCPFLSPRRSLTLGSGKSDTQSNFTHSTEQLLLFPLWSHFLDMNSSNVIKCSARPISYHPYTIFPQNQIDLFDLPSFMYNQDDERFTIETGVQYSCRSVLKQRAKKMNKHKYKKWRKKMKFKRRAH